MTSPEYKLQRNADGSVSVLKQVNGKWVEAYKIPAKQQDKPQPKQPQAAKQPVKKTQEVKKAVEPVKTPLKPVVVPKNSAEYVGPWNKDVYSEYTPSQTESTKADNKDVLAMVAKYRREIKTSPELKEELRKITSSISYLNSPITTDNTAVAQQYRGKVDLGREEREKAEIERKLKEAKEPDTTEKVKNSTSSRDNFVETQKKLGNVDNEPVPTVEHNTENKYSIPSNGDYTLLSEKDTLLLPKMTYNPKRHNQFVIESTADVPALYSYFGNNMQRGETYGGPSSTRMSRPFNAPINNAFGVVDYLLDQSFAPTTYRHEHTVKDFERYANQIKSGQAKKTDLLKIREKHPSGYYVEKIISAADLKAEDIDRLIANDQLYRQRQVSINDLVANNILFPEKDEVYLEAAKGKGAFGMNTGRGMLLPLKGLNKDNPAAIGNTNFPLAGAGGTKNRVSKYKENSNLGAFEGGTVEVVVLDKDSNIVKTYKQSGSLNDILTFAEKVKPKDGDVKLMMSDVGSWSDKTPGKADKSGTISSNQLQNLNLTSQDAWAGAGVVLMKTPAKVYKVRINGTNPRDTTFVTADPNNYILKQLKK